MVLTCPMKLYKFPLDDQTCSVTFESCKYRIRSPLLFSVIFRLNHDRPGVSDRGNRSIRRKPPSTSLLTSHMPLSVFEPGQW